MEKYQSFLLENAVNEFAKLPGIGRKTALRLVLHSLKREPKEVESFGNAIISFRNKINFCKICYNVCDNETCDICTDLSRDTSLICIVETIKEVLAIENTKQYHGLYHVLGGIISPMEGIRPGDLEIKSLIERVENNKIREIILALSTTMEGDTTNFYIYRKISSNSSNPNVKISVLARGISIGDEIEYTDEITLGKSILNRINFSDTIQF